MQPLTSTIDVMLVDDHHLVRAGIRSLLTTIPGIRVIAELSDANELLALLNSVHPDIVITDISMPGMDGITAILRIRERHPGVRVIVLSMHESADVVKRAIVAGACAYLRKDASDFELSSALHSVMTTGTYISSGVANLLLQPTEPEMEDLLTPRQVEILTLLARGLSSKEIAFQLGLSFKTVNVHRIRIMERLGIRDVASLTLYAVRKGLLQV